MDLKVFYFQNIKEFPMKLARPPVEPADFAYGDIRNCIIAQGGDDNGTVRYAIRRSFVAGLTFELKSCHIEVGDSINQKFIEISNRQASFNSMSTDEAIGESKTYSEEQKNFFVDYGLTIVKAIHSLLQ